MIYIKKSTDGKEFFVSVTGKNGKKLSTTETFKSKLSAWKNIYSQAENFNGNTFLVYDLTSKKERLFRVSRFRGKWWIKIKSITS